MYMGRGVGTGDSHTIYHILICIPPTNQPSHTPPYPHTPYPHTALSVYLGAPAIPGDFGATHGIDVDRLGWCVRRGYIHIQDVCVCFFSGLGHTLLQTHPPAPSNQSNPQNRSRHRRKTSAGAGGDGLHSGASSPSNMMLQQGQGQGPAPPAFDSPSHHQSKGRVSATEKSRSFV